MWQWFLWALEYRGQIIWFEDTPGHSLPSTEGSGSFCSLFSPYHRHHHHRYHRRPQSLWVIYIYMLYTMVWLQNSLTSSSKILNPRNSLFFLAVSLLLYSSYLFAGFQFPGGPSSTCPIPLFQPTAHPPLFSVCSWCITPLPLSPWPYLFVLCL